MSRITKLTATNAVVTVTVAVLPFAMVGRVRVSGRAFAPVQVAVALAGALAIIAAVVVIRAGVHRVRLTAFALAASSLVQVGCASTLVVALLMPPPYEWAMGLFVLSLLVAWMTALLAAFVALGARLRD